MAHLGSSSSLDLAHCFPKALALSPLSPPVPANSLSRFALATLPGTAVLLKLGSNSVLTVLRRSRGLSSGAGLGPIAARYLVLQSAAASDGRFRVTRNLGQLTSCPVCGLGFPFWLLLRSTHAYIIIIIIIIIIISIIIGRVAWKHLRK